MRYVAKNNLGGFLRVDEGTGSYDPTCYYWSGLGDASLFGNVSAANAAAKKSRCENYHICKVEITLIGDA